MLKKEVATWSRVFREGKKFLIFMLLTTPIGLMAQTGVVKGTIKDAGNGELLIGVNVVYAAGKGTVTGSDGSYRLELSYGTYELQVSYVGYVNHTSRIVVNAPTMNLNISLKNITLSEVEVVADLAQTRETPVAFTTISPLKIEEELASQDIPMLLTRTPGVYATQQGGGDGDARMNIRGFNQRNIAVMVDGIPVNDMENGWVYWSNWFGLDAVTRNIQVQRGLGASKLVIPSVGGTVNIIIKGIEDKARFSVKQEYGSDAFLRTSLGWNSGQLKNGWGITLAGSYKRGDGWVDGTWTEGWFYFARIDKKLGRHLVSLSAMGAPQKHGQRSYKKSIAFFDKSYAAEQGVDTAGMQASHGFKFNENWGYLQREGEDRELLSERMNYYHKPLISLRDFWNISERVYLSNIFYVSLGKGGGTGPAKSDKYGTPSSSTFPIVDSTGQINFQGIYDLNHYSEDGRSRGILRSSVNDHYWYGFLSTFNYRINELWEFSGGIDLRTYKGKHYMIVHDLLGGDYFLDNSNQNRGDIIRKEGDNIQYSDDGLVRWGGMFGLVKWRSGNWSAFANLSGSYNGYKRVDYYIPKELQVGDTALLIGYSDSVIYSGQMYTRYSKGLKVNQTPWRWFPGFTLKGGVNYNLSERSNLFMNLGYLSKSPRFNNVFYYDNVEFSNPENENVTAFELGYSYYSKKISLDVNGYLTLWKNKPADRTSTFVDPVEETTYQVNINGMNARHIGIEAEFNHDITRSLSYNLMVSVGNWIWTSEDTARVYVNNHIADSIYFNAKGVHVGDAAQTQFSGGIRWEIINDLYISGSATYFTRYFSEFDPISLSPDINPNYLDENGNPKESWQIPNYALIDINAGYTLKIKKVYVDFRGSVLNLLNTEYISDAQNNDTYSSPTQSFDAQSAGVFFGLGRRFNLSVKVSF
ncbi:MAG: TonB-dependent receptor [Bacteroidales bacterium]|nr:TonB-dependent receptor [Bacteroidales bacterium]